MIFTPVITLSRRQCALLFGCLLASSGALSRSDSGHVVFEVVKLSGSSSLAQQRDAISPADSSTVFVARAEVARLQALVAKLEEAGDYYSPALAEYSAQLGHALQRAGEHVAALTALDRSLHILRRNEGLSSNAQLAVLQSQFDSQFALGDIEACDALQQARFSMQLRLFADQPRRLAEAYAAYADWEIRYYFKAAESLPPQWDAEDRQALLAERLSQAFQHYHEALWNLAGTTGTDTYSSKVSIERKIAAITQMVDEQYRRVTPDILGKAGQRSMLASQRKHNRVLFEHGKSALTRTIEYSEATSQPELIAERMLELADWYLLMDQHDEARALYAKTALMLQDAGMPEERIAEIMQTGMPVRDPGKELTALALPTQLSGFDGYVDVTMDVDRYGQASNTQVSAGNVLEAAVEQRLLQRIHEERFRPTYDQGTLVDSKNVTLRYYFAQ